MRSGRPEDDEYAEYARGDVALVPGDDICDVLRQQAETTRSLFERFGDAGGGLSYAPEKWTVKEVLGHLADDERIFAYRALCVARGDERELAGFDERMYVRGARFTELPMAFLIEDYLAVRAASLTLFRGFGRESWLRRGRVNGYVATPRGLAFHIAGHELRHQRTITERYLPVARAQSWWPDPAAGVDGARG